MKTINLSTSNCKKEDMQGETVKAIIEEYNGGISARKTNKINLYGFKIFLM